MPAPFEEAAPRRRGLSLALWLLLAVFLLPVLFFLYLTFGPSPAIRVSKETTHLTAPLAADGYPDYAAVLLADMRRGVTPENNGAIPILEALWPEEGEEYDELTQEEGRLVCTELGMTYPPPAAARFTSHNTPENRLEALRLLRERMARSKTDDDSSGIGSEDIDHVAQEGLTVEEFLALPEEDALCSGRVNEFLWSYCQPVPRPWTAEDLPFLDVWVEQNEYAYQRLMEGLERSASYAPAPRLLRGGRGSIFELDLYSISLLRRGSRLLQTKANHSRGEGDYESASREVLAILHLGRHAGMRELAIDQLVACSISGIGCDFVNRLAGDELTPVVVLKRLLAEIDRLPALTNFAKAMDRGERYFAIDGLLGARGPMLMELYEDFSSGEIVSIVDSLSIDWNPVLIDVNAHYDAIVAARSLPLKKQQIASFATIETSMQAKQAAAFPLQDHLDRIWTAADRGKLIGDAWVGGYVLGPTVYFESENRLRTKRQMTRLGLALAIYHAEQGAYPESLEALAPGILKELPVDHILEKPFGYRRTEDGFLLYSLGPNGVDDGGSCEGGPYGGGVYRGAWIEPSFDDPSTPPTEEDQARYELLEKIPAGADDVSLRLPLPVEPWPWEE